MRERERARARARERERERESMSACVYRCSALLRGIQSTVVRE